MVFENIEKLKAEYTDRYVIVDDTCPELKRFRGQTGTVRTVNMSGRALVEFDAYSNIGWYDIDVDFLKIIEQPLQPTEPPAAAKPAAKAKAKPKAAKKPSTASPADILAAARGGAAATPKPAASMSPADILAAARGQAPATQKAAEKPAVKRPPPATDPSKMSAADILAAARSGAAAATTPAEPDLPDVEESAGTVAEVAPEPDVDVEVSGSTAAGSSSASPSSAGPLPTDVDAILAFCRDRDGN